jgi:hypothetical protein
MLRTELIRSFRNPYPRYRKQKKKKKKSKKTKKNSPAWILFFLAWPGQELLSMQLGTL